MHHHISATCSIVFKPRDNDFDKRSMIKLSMVMCLIKDNREAEREIIIEVVSTEVHLEPSRTSTMEPLIIFTKNFIADVRLVLNMSLVRLAERLTKVISIASAKYQFCVLSIPFLENVAALLSNLFFFFKQIRCGSF